MDNAGVFTLAALQIAAALPQSLLTPTTDLAGMTGVTLEANFQYGSGGTSCIAIVATSFDGGTTWRHIARFDFGTAARAAACNLSGILSKAVTTYTDLGAEGVNDGMLGDQLAVILQSTGTYANTTLTVRASVR